MRCGKAQSHLSSLRDGELRSDLVREVEAHLRDCDPCRAEADRLRRSDLAARGALPPEEPVGPAFIGDLERRIAREGDRPARDPAVGARALVPMAAAALLGASLTFVGLRAVGPARESTGADAAVPSEYGGFEATRDRFAAASDMLLTDLDDLSLADPEQELSLVRHEVAASGVEPALEAVRHHLPAAETRDPRLAGRLDHALRGMEAVLASLSRAGPPEDVLLHARREVLERRLVASVRGLAPEGLPRPADSGTTVRQSPVPGMARDTAVYLSGVRAYSAGQLQQARQAFVAARAIAPRQDRRARAAYWASRCYTLENRVTEAAEMLKDVNAWSPVAAQGMCRFILRQPGGDLTVFLSGEIAGGALSLEVTTGGVTAGGDAGGRATLDGAPLPDVGAPGSTGPADLRMALRLLESHGISLERELTRAWRLLPGAEVVLEPFLGHLTDVVAVRADGAPAEPADAPKLRRVLPVMLAKFADRGRLELHAAEADRVTVRLATGGIRFGTWEAQRFVEGLGGAIAAKLRGPEAGDEATALHSTLTTLELDVRLSDAARASGALRLLGPAKK